MSTSPKPTALEYVGITLDSMRALIEWRERWDARSPEDEEALRAEWQVLENRAHMVIATPVEGESD